MKTLLKFFSVAAVVLSLASCSKDSTSPDRREFFDATCTFRPSADGSYFVKIDEKTALRATNSSKYPFSHGKEQRAIIKYYVDSEWESFHPVEGFEKTINARIISLDTIRTKQPVVYDKSKEAEYGNDRIGLYLGTGIFPTTLIEDGYLSVCYDVNFPSFGSVISDQLTLVSGINPEDPYELELRFNCKGIDGPNHAALITDFCLRDLPSTEGKTVKLTLKWHSKVTGSQEKVQFDYISREDWD